MPVPVPRSDSEAYLKATPDKVGLACVSTCTWPALWPAMFSSAMYLRSSVVVEVKAVLLHYTLTDYTPVIILHWQCLKALALEQRIFHSYEISAHCKHIWLLQILLFLHQSLKILQTKINL